METLHLEGTLQRQSGMWKGWKRFTCQLRDDVLTCKAESKSSKASIKRDVINLSEAHSVVPVQHKLSSGSHFQISIKGGKTYTFSADSNETRTKWMSALQVAMQVRRRSLSQQSSPDECRETQYSDPWDSHRHRLPVLIDQSTSLYSQPYDYATETLSQNGGQTSARVNEESPYSEAVIGECEYAEPRELFEIERNSQRKNTKQNSNDDVQLRISNLSSSTTSSKMTSFASSTSSDPNYARIIIERDFDSQSPRQSKNSLDPDPKHLSDKDIEQFLEELKTVSFQTPDSVIEVDDMDYSQNFTDLNECLNEKGNKYRLVSRRLKMKGTYIDELRTLLGACTDIEPINPPASFQMDPPPLSES